MYGVTAYYLAVNSMALFSFWFYPLITGCITFACFGLTNHTFKALCGWLSILVLITFGGSAFGNMLGCVLTESISGIVVNQMFVILFNMGSGLFINTNSSSTFVVKFLSFISPVHYATELIMFRLLNDKNELLRQKLLDYLGFDYTY